MGSAGDPDHPERPPVASPDPEHAELGLPSSYLLSSLTACSCHPLAVQEAKLRRAVLNDTLQVIKNLLGAKALALKHKRKERGGEIATTRAESALREHSNKILRAQWRYNNSRVALLRLSTLESDCTTYLELKKEHLKNLKEYLEDDSRGIGQGYQSISWLWRTKAAENNEEWQVEGKCRLHIFCMLNNYMAFLALRVEWFRARQRYLQWEEELKLLKREMVMAARDFLTKQKVWHFKSQSFDLAPGMREYAAQKSDFFARLRADLTESCGEHVTVRTYYNLDSILLQIVSYCTCHSLVYDIEVIYLLTSLYLRIRL